MNAMLFSAGVGSRLKPWTDHHPKALAIVRGKTLLQRNIEYLQQYDIRNVVVNVHHFADQVEEAVKKAGGWGSEIKISDEREELLDTGGGLLKAKELLGNDSFLTLNVDVLTDANLKHFLASHQQESAVISLAISERASTRKLLFNKYNRLCGWKNMETGEEKISLQAKDMFPKSYSGLAIFDPSVFNYITLTGKFSLIDLYLSLAHDHKIAGYDHSESKFLDVGKPGAVEKAEAMFD